ncbi:triose-phosphate isomerase [Desulfatibacillum aliphaticivorans]|uniref:triose-phosphate isomerase n=1 Tax=Desulfatibacillum aliphaticivorans TaxID=218208 RepID=UPI0003F866C4|nr:triose-phosphate isomerase [Desulfatibacillum aliphaticivorans]
MDARTPLIAGNWKMFKTPQEAARDAAALAELVKGVEGVDVMIAPTFACLVPVAQALEGSAVALGAQNMHWETEGAYTGELSGPMLKAAGCSHVIIGHSERRQYFGETDETVNKKIKAALEAGLKAVLCIGETEEERDQEKTLNVLDKQLKDGLKDIFPGSGEDALVVAYEPVWAIGTGKTATDDQAQEAHAFIRKVLAELLGKDLAKSTRILYGGSVKPANIAQLMSKPDIDGGLVGGASLDPETFSQIVKFQ